MIRRTRPFAKTAKAAAFIAAVCLAGFGAPALAERPSFAAPSGNIICFEDSGQLVCLIFEANWSPRISYENCDLDETRLVVLPRTGPARAEWACHGDVFWPYPAPVLSYGSRWQSGGFVCSMNKDGVRCGNESGHSFHLRRARLVTN